VAALSWPAELPVTLPLQGLSVKPQTNVVRTTMDAGPQKARRRYTAKTTRYSGRFILTADAYEVFKLFYHTMLADGVLRFNFTDPQKLDVAEFRFAETYDANALDGLWEVAVTMERL